MPVLLAGPETSAETVKRIAAAFGTALLGAVLTGCNTPSGPSGVPASTASRELDSLAVASPHPSGYVRDEFGKGWANQGHGCDTREVVLKAQGQNVRTDDRCRPVSGTWTSPYDGKTYAAASGLQIDHVVPLGAAWAAGAWQWSPDQRRSFANDLADPELLAVSASLNEQKSDKGPDQWRPPLKSFWPTYAADWIAVKAKYRLTVTASEKNALRQMLG